MSMRYKCRVGSQSNTFFNGTLSLKLINNISGCLLCLAIGAFALNACSSPQALFSARSPHELYSDHITTARLNQTALGRSWLSAASGALLQPVAITLPYQESGYFAAAEPEAQGYRFMARRGENLQISYTRRTSRNFILFVDLWQSFGTEQPKWVASLDTSSATLQYEVKKDGVFLLRLQPELLTEVDYTLVIKTAPSLGFPVSGTYHPRIGSFWGDSRDAGARSHEGLDIFGAFRTPVIAAADGVATSVTLNRLGGKVVFMRPSGKDYALYYAHLDSQLVQQGQRVKTGDTLGLMGNTGNAKNTPTHLHFGIYAFGGAVDPLPFIQYNRPAPKDINVSLSRINQYGRTGKASAVYAAPHENGVRLSGLEKNTMLRIKAATGAWYKVQLPDKVQGFVPGNVVADAETLSIFTLPDTAALRDRPDTTAAVKSMLAKNSKVRILGTFKNYHYVSGDSRAGWLLRTETRKGRSN